MDGNAAHYTVMARRFRPQTFADVVGQQHVAQALVNAIAAGRVAHAYLFTGARGVGKTSMARILAKALNCPHIEDGVPCNQCEICEGIAAGHDVDVMEIDGASNRGIDDIRTLRANVVVKSMRTLYKMYIIDEVHMLTKEAFNALLKTLEEPPPNVKFVFCTTEPNKVPDTILSRCQRFDFSTIEMANIVNRLGEIAQAESVAVEPAALELVARRAAGSMRDSQSLFDQLLAFGQDQVVAADVHRLLGTAGDERMAALVEALVSRRKDLALSEFDQALSEGVQLEELIDQLLNYLRDLMVLGCGSEMAALLGASNEQRDRLTDQARRWGLQTIVASLEILAETKTRMFRASFARALAELALVRICLLEDLEELGQLVRALKSGEAVPLQAASAKVPSNAATSAGHGGENASPKSAAADLPAEKQKKNEQNVNLSSQEQQSAPKVAAVVKFQSDNKDELWAQIVSDIHDVLKDHVRAVTSVAIFGPNVLELTFPKSYHFSKQYCERSESVGRLERLASERTGQSIRITFRLEDVAEVESAATDESPSPSRGRKRFSGPVDDEFVEEARSVFGATIIKVEPMVTSEPEEDA
jgi:DNA polymerase-3 subunit gamma/tau